MNQLGAVVVMVIFLAFCAAANVLDPETKVANNFIQETCNRTQELKDVCISVIHSNPHEDLKSNLTGLLALFINQTLHAVVDDHSYLLNQTQNAQLDDQTRQAFTSCVTQYQMSRDSLQVLLQEQLLSRQNTDLNMDLGQIDNYLALCEIDFEGFAAEPSAWKSRYHYVSSLLILSLRITNLIKCNQIHACF